MKKKLISLLCVIMLFSMTITETFGATYAVTASPAPARSAYEKAYQDSYYSQLSEAQQKYYQMMETAYLTDGMPNGNVSIISHSLQRNEIKITVNPSDGSLTAASTEIIKEIYNDISYAYFALVYDHPQLYWVKGVKQGIKYAYSSNGAGYLTKIEITPQISYTGAETKIDKFVAGIDEAVAKIKNDRSDVSVYATTKAIHDYLCNRLTYNYDAVGKLDAYKSAHSVGPVFTESSPSVVCEGYARSFKILCDAFDIPCVLIIGKGKDEAHLWNYVQMEGRWYAVDVTWDDKSSISYQYFLVGQSDMSTHKPISTGFAENGTVSFVFPTLSPTFYQPETIEPGHVHKWNNGEITKKATCKEEGVKTYRCTSCGTVKTETIAKLTTHSYAEKLTPATTTKNGSIKSVCTACGDVASSKTIYKASGVKLSYSTKVYTGKMMSPKVYVKDSKGNTISSKYYTISKPSGRKNTGKYTYTIKFKGNYSGKKTLTLTINPKAPTLTTPAAGSKAVTVKWKKGLKTQVTGYEVRVATNSKFTKNVKKATVTKYSTVSKKMTKLKAKTKYYVQVRAYKTVKVSGTKVKIYSTWSGYKTCKTR